MHISHRGQHKEEYNHKTGDGLLTLLWKKLSGELKETLEQEPPKKDIKKSHKKTKPKKSSKKPKVVDDDNDTSLSLKKKRA